MLRVIAGTYRSRKLDVPEEYTIPTKDRVREALFSSLGDKVHGARVLDAFAGSGALGIEALSRGAAFCLFSDIHTASIVQKNLDTLNETKAKVESRDILEVLKTETQPFDLIFLDPPYAEKEIYQRVIDLLKANNLLNEGYRIVLEYEGDYPIDPSSYAYAREKKYGYSKILVIGKE